MQITSGEDLHNIVLNAPIGICILDAATLKGEIVNDKFLEVAGKPYDAIAGKFYWDAFAEARQYYEYALSGVVESGEPYYANEVELMLIRHGKEEIVFVTFVYSPIKNKKGKVTKVAVWVLENTMQVVARQKIEVAERQARESLSTFRSMILQAPVAMCLLTGSNHAVEVANDLMIEIWGKKDVAIIGKPLFEFLPEAKEQGFDKLLDRVYETGETFYANERLIDLLHLEKLERLYINFVYEAYKNGDDTISGVFVVATDVTAQVLARQKSEENESELLAINEEMVATNEELTAVNEEMAVTNEELVEAQATLARMNLVLRENESRLKMAIEATSLGTWEYNPISGTLYWSDQCKNIFGFPVEKPITFAAFSSLIYPDDRARVLEEFQKSITGANDNRYDISYRIIRFDNHHVRWVRVRGTVNFDTRGQASRFIGTLLDITDSELAQERIARSEKLFRSIALNIPRSLIIVIDKEHRYVMVEGDIMEKLGYDRKDYEGKHPAELSPERYEASKDLFDRVIGGEHFTIERKGNSGEDYIIHFVPLKNEQDEVYAGMILLFDISDIKQAEEKSAKLAAIVQSSDDAIISKTLESVITSWNDSAERMFGYAADEIIGQTIYKLIPPDRQDEEPLILSRLKNGERVEHFETKRVRKDGQLLDVSLTISPVKDVHGNIIGLSKIARDITERKLDEARKNDFIGIVSHELKTPLTSLNAITQVVNAKLKKSDDTFLSGAMEKATRQVKRMAGLINGFLDISRLESGKILVEKKPFKLDELLHEIADETVLTVNTHTVSLAKTVPVEVDADRERINSVISNLVSNAVKYSANGTRIEIKCRVRTDSVVVSVKDQGMGVSLNDLDKIFDRYYRVESSNTQHISGFGIGLYLSAEIIKRHEGKIWAKSESGKGSTFYFSLPLN